MHGSSIYARRFDAIAPRVLERESSSAQQPRGDYFLIHTRTRSEFTCSSSRGPETDTQGDEGWSKEFIPDDFSKIPCELRRLIAGTGVLARKLVLLICISATLKKRRKVTQTTAGLLRKTEITSSDSPKSIAVPPLSGTDTFVELIY